MVKEHEDLEVSIHGPDEKYRSIMLSISSKGAYHLSSGHARATLTIHALSITNLCLIRNVIDAYLDEHPDEVKAEEEAKAAIEAAEAVLKKGGKSDDKS